MGDFSELQELVEKTYGEGSEYQKQTERLVFSGKLLCLFYTVVLAILLGKPFYKEWLCSLGF